MGIREEKIPKLTYMEWMKNLLSLIWREKNSTTRCSTLINTIKSPTLISNRVSVKSSVGDSVDGVRYMYVIKNRLIFVIDYESNIPELRKIVTCHILPSAHTERKQLPFL